MNGLLHHLVAYADTDAGGVMYHGRYVELAERSRLAAFHEMGWTMARLESELALKLVVHRLGVQFKRPARLEERLSVSSHVQEASEARCVFVTQIQRGTQLLARLNVHLVGVADGRLARLPTALLRDLQTPAAPPRTERAARLTLVPLGEPA